MSDSLELRDGEVSLAFDLRDGVYALRLPGFVLHDCRATAEVDGRTLVASDWRRLAATARTLTLAGRFPFGELQLSFALTRNGDGMPGVALDATLTLAAAMPEGSNIAPLHLPALLATHLIAHGRRMGGCRLLPLPLPQTDYTSHFLAMITRHDHTLQLAQPLRQRHPALIRAQVRHDTLHDLRVETALDRLPAGTHPLAALRLFAAADGHALMRAYGEAERTPGAPRPAHFENGWNSWDYYRWTITEQEVLKNAAFIRDDPVLSRHIRRIIIDDGWQYCYGEWEPNPLFPSGMGALARNLRDLGFDPGLWIAPTIIEPHCRICQTDPGLLAQGSFGEPILAFQCMQRRGFLLDPTLPRAQAWLRDLFSRYCDLGFTYFKLDFLGATLNAPVFADRTVGRGEIMRQILTPIREATRGRARILGCNYLFDGGDDLVDGVRTSGDIHAHWKSIKGNVWSIAARFWMQDCLWDNDPDFAVCRGPDTSDDPLNAIFRPGLVYYTPEQKEPHPAITSLADATLDEARTLLSLVIVSGGCVNLSDCLYKLNARGLALVRKTAAFARGAAGLPLDLFQAEYPAQWLQPCGDRLRVLLINWNDEPAELTLDLTGRLPAAAQGVDLWTDEPLRLEQGRLTRRLAPHGCLLAEITV